VLVIEFWHPAQSGWLEAQPPPHLFKAKTALGIFVLSYKRRLFVLLSGAFEGILLLLF